MNRILLDTHVWIWYAEDVPSTLSRKTLSQIDGARRTGDLLVSAVSLWEIGLLCAKKRISLSAPLRVWGERALDLSGLRCVPLDERIAIESTLLPGDLHYDPADRFLIATAWICDAALMTRDQAILDYGSQGHCRVIPA